MPLFLGGMAGGLEYMGIGDITEVLIVNDGYYVTQ